MDKKQICYDLLEELKIEYKKVEHEAVYTCEEMDRLHLNDYGIVLKNLFLRDGKGKKHFLVVFKGEKEVNLKELGENIGSRLSFASEERLLKYLNLTKGSVTPLGVYFDKEHEVEVYFDDELSEDDIVGVHPFENTATIYLRFGELKSIVMKNNSCKMMKL